MKDCLTIIFTTDADARTAHLRTLNATPFSSQWLVEPLASNLSSLNELSSSEWQDLLRYRLGLPLMQDSVCRACSGHSDSLGDHALSCASCGRYARHNALQEVLADELRKAGFTVTTEDQVPHTEPPDRPPGSSSS